MDSKVNPDQIIQDIGGCGRYQWRMSFVIHMMQTCISWNIMLMIVATNTPQIWYCADMSDDVIYNKNSTIESSKLLLKSCTTLNGTKCTKFRFEGASTLVSSFDLVCDKAYIPATIMSIQMAGKLTGNLVAGHLADMFGRKIPLFSSFVGLIICNGIGVVAEHWILIAVCRFTIGSATCFFLSVQFSLLCEFTSSKWRVWVVGFPSWTLQMCLLALVAWLVQDWKPLMSITGLMGVPCLLMWWYIPESFRWYLAYNRPQEADKVIKSVAAFNKCPVSSQLLDTLDNSKTNEKEIKYTVLDLFKTKYLIRITLFSAMNWASLGLISYGINFGIQQLSGSIYLNFFLLNLSGFPSTAVSIWLQNRIGRRKTSMLCYFVMGLGGFVVGIVQYIDTPYRDGLTNGFAIFAYLGVTGAWDTVQTMTIELYPTVIRTTASGSLAVVCRVGAMVGPQLVFMNKYIPGLLYFVCGILATICTLGLMGLPETMDVNLRDKIDTVNQQNTKLSDKIDTVNEQNVKLNDKIDGCDEQSCNLIDKPYNGNEQNVKLNETKDGVNNQNVNLI